MEPGGFYPCFTIPIESARPKGAAHFECWAPKLKRRFTLFDPFHVRLLAFLESIPRVSCARTHGICGRIRALLFWKPAAQPECRINNYHNYFANCLTH